MVDKSEVLKHC